MKMNEKGRENTDSMSCKYFSSKIYLPAGLPENDSQVASM